MALLFQIVSDFAGSRSPAAASAGGQQIWPVYMDSPPDGGKV